jgi:predicted AAA+ superfamily ATPase
MLIRYSSIQIENALDDTPVVLLTGARQTGKSTLAQQIASKRQMPYATLDEFSTLAAAQNDPEGFVSAFQDGLVLDEVQRAPQLFLALKAEVDRNRKPGRFLLTGSANVLLLPKVADSLAGRMEVQTLYPFSEGELQGRKSFFLENAMQGNIALETPELLDRGTFFQRLLIGGYPEVQTRSTELRRNAWFGAYLTTILQRDIQELGRIEGTAQLPKLLQILGTQTASLLNLSNLSRDTGLTLPTLKRYITLLEMTYLIETIPAWFRNLGKRLIKTPKTMFGDTGLLGYLLGLDQARLEMLPIGGAVLENFVANEIRKQLSWMNTPATLYFFRDTNGIEVDFVLENRRGALVGIEVKRAQSVVASDFRGLNAFQKVVGDDFQCGIVLYLGNKVIPFGNKLYAVPIQCLWN